MFFQRAHFPFGKHPHGVSFQRVTGDVLHDFHGSLFRREIGSSRTVTARALVAADVADLYRDLLDEGRSLTNCFARVPKAACFPARWRRTIIKS